MRDEDFYRMQQEPGVCPGCAAIAFIVFAIIVTLLVRWAASAPREVTAINHAVVHNTTER